MHTVGPGLWGCAAALALITGAILLGVVDQIRWFRRPPGWARSLACVCLLIATGCAVWAATRYSDVQVAAAGFGPGWNCPPLPGGGAVVCFRDRPAVPPNN